MELQQSIEKSDCYNKIWRGSIKPGCDSGRVRCASKGDEGFKAECRTRKPLPLPYGGVWQFEDGACIYGNQIFDLLEEEFEEPSQTMGVIEGKNWWNHLILHSNPTEKMRSCTKCISKLIDIWCHLSSPEKHKPILNLHLNMVCSEVRSRMKVERWRLIRLLHQNYNLLNQK